MALKTENCPWQALVDIAYDRWRAHNDSVSRRHVSGDLSIDEARKLLWSEEEHLLACSVKEREACILGKLNQQIENGGVTQWIDNGYAYAATKFGLWRLLDEMGETSQKIAKLIRPYVEDHMDKDYSGEFRQYTNDKMTNIDNCGEIIDNKFYELQDKWHLEVYARLNPVISNEEIVSPH